jgi:hypothetical protein
VWRAHLESDSAHRERDAADRWRAACTACGHPVLATLKNLLRRAPLLVALLAGCADTAAAYTPLNVPPRPVQARSPDEVELFSSAPPERPHVDVGLITVQEGDGDETPAALLGLLRQVAAERGCDAVVVAPPASKTAEQFPFGETRSYQVYSGTCLVYGIAAPRSAAPASPANLRRMCRDRRDFDQNRNCVLAALSSLPCAPDSP